MTEVVPNPVMLTVVSESASNMVGVKIYDNGVYLERPANQVLFVGLYQNGEEVGSVSYEGKRIHYGSRDVLQIFSHNDYTFALRLIAYGLANGDYVAVVSYTKDGVTKNYEVPIRIELSREAIMKYRQELKLTDQELQSTDTIELTDQELRSTDTN